MVVAPGDPEFGVRTAWIWTAGLTCGLLLGMIHQPNAGGLVDEMSFFTSR